jgi:hypothetical protein
MYFMQKGSASVASSTDNAVHINAKLNNNNSKVTSKASTLAAESQQSSVRHVVKGEGISSLH